MAQGSGFSLYFGGYRAKDGGVVLGALTPANRDAIRTVLGVHDDPFDTPGFDPTDDASKAFIEGLRARIRGIFLTRSVAEWVRLFDVAGAPAAPVRFRRSCPTILKPRFISPISFIRYLAHSDRSRPWSK